MGPSVLAETLIWPQLKPESLPDPPRTGWVRPGLASMGEKEAAQPSLASLFSGVLGIWAGDKAPGPARCGGPWPPQSPFLFP